MGKNHRKSTSGLQAKGSKDYNENLRKLKEFVAQSPYIDCLEQPQICANFNLPYIKEVFRQEYRRRFLSYLFKNTTSIATVSKYTGIPEKYLTCCSRFYKNRDLVRVVYLDRCQTTGSRNVQQLSSNPDRWNDTKPTNQLSLF